LFASREREIVPVGLEIPRRPSNEQGQTFAGDSYWSGKSVPPQNGCSSLWFVKTLHTFGSFEISDLEKVGNTAKDGVTMLQVSGTSNGWKFLRITGATAFSELSSLFLYYAVEPGVRLNSIRERLVNARLQRGTAKTGSHAFSARSSFLTIRPCRSMQIDFPDLRDGHFGQGRHCREGTRNDMISPEEHK
jgi:hypothetical protein